MRAVYAAVVVSGKSVLDLLEHQTAASLRFGRLVVERNRGCRRYARDIGGVRDANALHLIGRVERGSRGDAGDGVRRGRPCAGRRNRLGVEGVLFGEFAPISAAHQLIPRGVHQREDLHYILVGITRHR